MDIKTKKSDVYLYSSYAGQGGTSTNGLSYHRDQNEKGGPQGIKPRRVTVAGGGVQARVAEWVGRPLVIHLCGTETSLSPPPPPATLETKATAWMHRRSNLVDERSRRTERHGGVQYLHVDEEIIVGSYHSLMIIVGEKVKVQPRLFSLFFFRGAFLFSKCGAMVRDRDAV